MSQSRRVARPRSRGRSANSAGPTRDEPQCEAVPLLSALWPTASRRQQSPPPADYRSGLEAQARPHTVSTRGIRVAGAKRGHPSTTSKAAVRPIDEPYPASSRGPRRPNHDIFSFVPLLVLISHRQSIPGSADPSTAQNQCRDNARAEMCSSHIGEPSDQRARHSIASRFAAIPESHKSDRPQRSAPCQIDLREAARNRRVQSRGGLAPSTNARSRRPTSESQLDSIWHTRVCGRRAFT
jgi:hypothetical protein